MREIMNFYCILFFVEMAVRTKSTVTLSQGRGETLMILSLWFTSKALSSFPGILCHVPGVQISVPPILLLSDGGNQRPLEKVGPELCLCVGRCGGRGPQRGDLRAATGTSHPNAPLTDH